MSESWLQVKLLVGLKHRFGFMVWVVESQFRVKTPAGHSNGNQGLGFRGCLNRTIAEGVRLWPRNEGLGLGGLLRRPRV